MISISAAIAIIFGLGLILVGAIYFNYRTKATASLAKYAMIIDLENEEARLSAANRRMRDEIKASEDSAAEAHGRLLSQYRQAEETFLENDQKSRAALSFEYQAALCRYQELQKELAIGEDSLEDLSFGVYKPHFTFQTPEEYKSKIEQLRDQQREVIRKGDAAQCPTAWTVNNSKVEGKRMIRLHSKLMLRAFNGECEAAIANVSWSNASKMEERIRAAFSAINKLGR